MIPQGHHLAAILFTDIVGYTAMMQKDQVQALAALRRHNHAIDQYSKVHGGEVVNFYGDGCLAVFPSAIDAIHCATDVQKELQTAPAVPVRIGLHTGEIFYEEGKAIGDGVNVASRIQSLGIGNSILLSSDLNNSIKNQSDIKTVSLGLFHFKNVDKPMEVFAVANEGLIVPKRQEMSGKLKDQTVSTSRRTVAIAVAFILILLSSWFIYRLFSKLPNSLIVLPFTTQDSSQVYFAEGITFDVIAELAKVRDITTLSSNTSFAYINTKKPFEEIASETDVSYVLTGTIQKYQDKIRVNVELMNPENNKSLWANSWNEEIRSVFDIQKQIAREVADKLGVKLSYKEESNLDRYGTKNIDAYDLFLKARAESRKFNGDPAFLHRSNHLLEEALKIDPDFPQAYSLRANNLIDLTLLEGLDPAEQAAKAKEDVNRSLSLDPTYSDNYLILGTINFFLEWKMKEAEKNFEKGWELSNYGEAPIIQCFCGFIEYTIIKGDYQKAFSLINKVEKIEPDYPYAAEERALIFGILQDTASLRKMLEEPSTTIPHKPISYYELGYYDQAINGFLKSNVDFPLSFVAAAYYKQGKVEKSDSIINHLIIKSEKEKNIDFNLALIFAARGEKEKALQWYKSGYMKHDLGTIYIGLYSPLKLIINEPEVQQILKEIGI